MIGRKACTALGLSVISLLISSISIGISAYRPLDLGVDYLGIIVGLLAVLVTLLIGWNIYTVIDVKKSVSLQNENIAKIDNSVKSKILEIWKDAMDYSDTTENQSLIWIIILYIENPELDRFNSGYIILYRLHLIENHLNSGKIDQANSIVDIINTKFQDGVSISAKGKKELIEFALSIDGIGKLKEGEKLMSNIFNL